MTSIGTIVSSAIRLGFWVRHVIVWSAMDFKGSWNVFATQRGSDRYAVPQRCCAGGSSPCHVLIVKTMVKVDLALLEAHCLAIRFTCFIDRIFAMAVCLTPILTTLKRNVYIFIEWINKWQMRQTLNESKPGGSPILSRTTNSVPTNLGCEVSVLRFPLLRHRIT